MGSKILKQQIITCSDSLQNEGELSIDEHLMAQQTNILQIFVEFIRNNGKSFLHYSDGLV